MRRRNERGVALIFTLILMVIFVILIGGLLDALALESQNLQISDSGNTALNAAYAGVDAIVLQTEQWYTGTDPGPAPSALPTYDYPQDPTGQQVSYAANITQTWHSTGLAYYLIDSVGTVVGPCGSPCVSAETHTREVRALVRQRPYTHYGLFVAKETPNVGGAIWYTNQLSFGGPVYSGGRMHIMYDDNAGQSIFGSTVDTAQGPQWDNLRNPTGPQAPQNGTDWAAVIAGGQGSFHVLSMPLSLPSFADNLLVASEAYYGDAKHTSALPSVGNGVYVNGSQSSASTLKTGIYVQGDVNVYTSGDAVRNTETIEFTPTTTDDSIANDVTVVINFGPGNSGNGTTIVTTSTPSGQVISSQTYDGVPSGSASTANSEGNGAIFVNGSVTVAGSVTADPNNHVGEVTPGPATIHGQYDLAVPDNASDHSNSITLTDSLRYSQGESTATTDELALWANNIQLSSAVTGAVDVDGLILTGYAGETPNDGTFFNTDCKRRACTGGTGDLNLYGSLVENIRGKFGTVQNGSLTGGYARIQQYDPRLGANPPPFSPTTNQFEVVALFDNGGNLTKP